MSGRFNISNTLVSSFDDEAKCLRKFRATRIDKLFKESSKHYFSKGSYFESQVIGSSAKDEIDETWRKSNSGALTADAKRIDAQIEVFKKMFDPDSDKFKGFKILDDFNQKTIYHRYDGFTHKGILDFMMIDQSKEYFEGKPILTDLKLLGNMHHSMYNPNDPNFPLSQLKYYKAIYCLENNIDFDSIGLAYLLFDYSPAMNKKLVIVNASQQDCMDVFHYNQDRGEEIEALYDEYGEDIEDWEVNPSVKNCKDCLLKCDKRIDEYSLDIMIK